MASFARYFASKWLTLICCLFLNGFTSGFIASYGVMLVLIHDTFGMSRKEASIPIAVGETSFFLFSILSGTLLNTLKVRKALTFSVAMGALGTFLMFVKPFSSELPWISFCMALKSAGMTHVFPIILQHLTSDSDEHRAKVYFLLLTGYSLSAVAFPLILEGSASHFGLRGAWLIECAFYVQTFVFICSLKSNDYKLKSETTYVMSARENESNEEHARLPKNKSEQFDSNSEELLPLSNKKKYQTELRTDHESMQEQIPLSKNKFELEIGRSNINSEELVPLSRNKYDYKIDHGTDHESMEEKMLFAKNKCQFKVSTSNIHSEELVPLSNTKYNYQIYQRNDQESVGEQISLSDKKFELEIHRNTDHEPKEKQRSLLHCDSEYQYNFSVYHKSKKKQVPFSKNQSKHGIDSSTDHERSQLTTHLSEIWKVAKKPIFHIILLLNTCLVVTYITFYTIVVDLSRDRQAGQTISLAILSLMYAVEFVGYFTGSVIIEKTTLPHVRLAWICYLVLSLWFIVVSLTQGYLFVIATLLVGFTVGIIFILMLIILPVLGNKNVAFAYGSSNALSGIIVILLPIFIGYFRDNLGDYKYITFILAAFNALTAAITALYDFSKPNS